MSWPRWAVRLRRLTLLVACSMLLGRGSLESTAQDQPPEAAPDSKPPIGQFLTVPSPIDDAVFGKVSRMALALQVRAQQENRRGVLVLEITPGSSQFHQVQGLAKFLSTDLPSLTTVAWIPKTVRGNTAVLALACQEIIMHPDAALGDLGAGKALDLDEQSFVINLVKRRQNRKLNEALVLGMMDPAKEAIWVQLQTGEKPNTITETRVVSPSEFDRLLKSKAVILNHKTIKEAGTDGLLSGDQARSANVLVMHLASSREEVSTLYQLPREAMREDPTSGAAPKAILIRVDEMIEPVLEQFVRRQIERAVANGANLLIFEIDSPGGYIQSADNLTNAIIDLPRDKVRTVAYIPKEALSAAAMIALGCDEVYMQPHAKIGDAAPIEIGKGGAFERAPEKILSVWKAMLRTVAEKKRRPPALLEAMADKNLEVFEVTHRDNGQVSYMTDDEVHNSKGEWVKGRQLPETGHDMLLTVDGRRANALHLAEPTVADFDELKTRLGIPSDTPVPVSTRTWIDTLVFVLNTPAVTSLLFVVGLICIYMELHFPVGLFGILSATCFAVFFWSRFLSGTAGWLEVVLFLLGVGCIAMEVFVMPGFGVFGVSGGLLVLFSLIMASQTFIIPATQQDFEGLVESMATLGGAALTVGVLAAVLSRYLPSIPMFNAMILTPPGAEGAAPGEPQLYPWLAGSTMPASGSLLEREKSLVGQEGVAQTMLRPAGKALVNDQLLDVISDGPFIPAGQRVEVVAVEGNRVVVRGMI